VVARIGLDLAGDLRPVGRRGHQTHADGGQQSVAIAGADGLLRHELVSPGDVADGLRPDRTAQSPTDCHRALCGVGVVESLEDLPDTEGDSLVGGAGQVSPAVPQSESGENAPCVRVEHGGSLAGEWGQHQQSVGARWHGSRLHELERCVAGDRLQPL
jgi:hypothetical protein